MSYFPNEQSSIYSKSVVASAAHHEHDRLLPHPSEAHSHGDHQCHHQTNWTIYVCNDDKVEKKIPEVKHLHHDSSKHVTNEKESRKQFDELEPFQAKILCH